MRSYAVIGTGAVACTYGVRLAAAGHEVHFVARGDLSHIREHGLRLDTAEGAVELPEVSAHGAADDLPAVDVVVVAVKTTANHRLGELVGPLSGPDRIVVLLQNGLGIEADAAAACHPGTTVVGGLCFVCSTRVGPGHVVHSDYGSVTLGQHSPDGRPTGATDAVVAVSDDLRGCGVDTKIADDLIEARWRKLVWNVPYNGLSALLDAGTDELMAHPGTRGLVTALMAEVVAASHATGHGVAPSVVDQMLEATDAMTPYDTSMRLDVRDGRPAEIETILSRPLRAAREAGVATPHLEALEAALSFVQDRRHSEMS